MCLPKHGLECSCVAISLAAHMLGWAFSWMAMGWAGNDLFMLWATLNIRCAEHGLDCLRAASALVRLLPGPSLHLCGCCVVQLLADAVLAWSDTMLVSPSAVLVLDCSVLALSCAGSELRWPCVGPVMGWAGRGLG
jgi:hypothetical protein